MKHRFAALAAAICLAISPMPVFSEEEQDIELVEISKDDIKIQFTTIGAAFWKVSEEPIIIENDDGSLSFVDTNYREKTTSYTASKDPVIRITTLEKDGSTRSITTLPYELKKFGCYYEGSDAYYFAFGEDSNNPYDPDKEMMRIVKYSKNWERLGSCSLYGAYADDMFRMSPSMTECNGLLALSGDRMMNGSGDLNGHQASMFCLVRTSDMTVVREDTNPYKQMNYISHSLNALVQSDETENRFYYFNEGDAYPKGYKLFVTGYAEEAQYQLTGSKYTVMKKDFWIDGAGVPQSDLYSLQLSPQNCVVFGSDYEQSETYVTKTQNLFLVIAERANLDNNQQIWLTDYNEVESEDMNMCMYPKFLRLSDNHFAVLWTEYRNQHHENELPEDTKENAIKYNGQDIIISEADNYVTKCVIVDGYGKKISDTKSYTGVHLDNYQPLLTSDGKVTFPTTVTNIETHPYYRYEVEQDENGRTWTNETWGGPKLARRTYDYLCRLTLPEITLPDTEPTEVIETTATTVTTEPPTTAPQTTEPSTTEPLTTEPEEPHSGTFGDSLTWELNDSGTLTVSGTGEMPNAVPWSSLKEEIQRVVIEEGVTSIAPQAFAWCDQIKSVSIAESVQTIGKGAFSDCDALMRVTLLNPESFIGIDSTFSNHYDSENECSVFNGTICGYFGSTAHEYAIVKQYSFEQLPGEAEITPLPDAEAPREGTCGEAVSWSLDENGVLTISGTGEMENYTELNLPPWYVRRTEIKRVVVEDGVTGIGDYAFYRCRRMRSFSLAESVNYIGICAFSECHGLTRITIPEGVKTIAAKAFFYCVNLTDVTVLNPKCSFRGGDGDWLCDRSETVGISSRYYPFGGTIHAYSGSTAEKGAAALKRSVVLLEDEPYAAEEIPDDFTAAETPVVTQMIGDVDGDGAVNASDAAEALIAAAILGAGGDPELTEAQQTAADVNGDGDINAADATIILQYAAAVGAGQSDAKIEDF